MSIKQRLTALCLVASGSLAVVAVVTYLNVTILRGALNDYSEQAARVERLFQVNSIVGSLAAPYNNAVVRLMMGEDASLNAAKLSQIIANLEEAERLVRSDGDTKLAEGIKTVAKEAQEGARAIAAGDSYAASEQYLKKVEPVLTEVLAATAHAMNVETANTKESHLLTENRFNFMRVTTGVFVLCIIAATIVISLFCIRSILTPLGEILEVVKAFGAGDRSRRVRWSSKDELGVLAAGFNETAEATQRTEQQITAKIQQLQEVMAAVGVAVSKLDQCSQVVADTSQSLAHGATKQANALQEITHSVGELNVKVSTNAGTAAEASTLSANARHLADECNAQMQALTTVMAEVGEAGERISSIVKVINDIAGQTNLLSLNAAVEAARAGQHGKGFAVVAEEVRSLAKSSAEAAQQTAALIRETVAKTDNGIKMTARTAAALEEVVSTFNEAAALVGSIAIASREQADAISQISSGLGEVGEVTSLNTASSEESAAAAEDLRSHSTKLRALLDGFRR